MKSSNKLGLFLLAYIFCAVVIVGAFVFLANFSHKNGVGVDKDWGVLVTLVESEGPFLLNVGGDLVPALYSEDQEYPFSLKVYAYAGNNFEVIQKSESPLIVSLSPQEVAKNNLEDPALGLILIGLVFLFVFSLFFWTAYKNGF